MRSDCSPRAMLAHSSAASFAACCPAAPLALGHNTPQCTPLLLEGRQHGRRLCFDTRAARLSVASPRFLRLAFARRHASLCCSMAANKAADSAAKPALQRSAPMLADCCLPERCSKPPALRCRRSAEAPGGHVTPPPFWCENDGVSERLAHHDTALRSWSLRRRPSSKATSL